MNSDREYGFVDKALAWSVHVFTALGIVAAFMSLIAVSEQRWRESLMWLVVCQFIDGVDGTFARKFKVREVLPQMNGKYIDYVIDFAAYAIIPAYFLYESGLLPDEWALAGTALVLLVSAVYYGKENMISEDMYFVGFPVMWNVAVFFLFFVVDLEPYGNLVLVILFSILHFVPLKYPYPSQMPLYPKFNFGLAMLAIATALLILWLSPKRYWQLNYLFTGFIIYWHIVGVYVTLVPIKPKNNTNHE